MKSSKSRLPHLSLIRALVLLCLTIILCFGSVVRTNHGHFSYALDDAYIHMAMAKNFAQHGVWGITRYEFSSSSSSLFWAGLLSVIYLLFGVNTLAPFVLNFLSAIGLICLIYYILRKEKAPPFFIFIVLLAVIFFTPLPALIFSGMEHTLHALVTIAFVYLSGQMLTKEKNKISESLLHLLLGALSISIRYEAMFLVFVVGCLFLLRKRFAYAFLLGAVSFLPIFMYGVFSMLNGWEFFPASLLLKREQYSIYSLGGILDAMGLRGLWKIYQNTHILSLVMISLGSYIFRQGKKENFWDDKKIMIVIFLSVLALHVQFARLNWFFRYDAYLVALGLFCIGICFCAYPPGKLSIKINHVSPN